MVKRMMIAALVAVLAACAGDSTGPEAELAPSANGTYALQSVNGVPLPTVLSDGVSSLTVTGGTLELEENGRFSHVIRFDGVPDLVGSGGWTLEGGVVTLSYDQQDFGVEFGAFATDQITIGGGLTLVYRR